MPKLQLIHDKSKGGESDLTLANMCVPVNA
jgi:hypothetical protein